MFRSVRRSAQSEGRLIINICRPRDSIISVARSSDSRSRSSGCSVSSLNNSSIRASCSGSSHKSMVCQTVQPSR